MELQEDLEVAAQRALKEELGANASAELRECCRLSTAWTGALPMMQLCQADHNVLFSSLFTDETMDYGERDAEAEAGNCRLWTTGERLGILAYGGIPAKNRRSARTEDITYTVCNYNCSNYIFETPKRESENHSLNCPRPWIHSTSRPGCMPLLWAVPSVSLNVRSCKKISKKASLQRLRQAKELAGKEMSVQP